MRTTRTAIALGVSIWMTGCAVEYIDDILAERGVTECTTTTETASTTTTGDSSSSSSGSSDGSAGETVSSGEMTTTGTDAGSTGGESTGSSTTGSGPACGDGEVEGEEECDDANTVEQDGCRSDCTREWYVFATSLTDGDALQSDDIKGIVGADYQCRHRATQMFLPNGDRYKAWISTSEAQPVDRLYHARGPYKLINGLQVAASWDALVTGPLEHPINVDEMSQSVHFGVWTGTNPDGTRAQNSTHCDDWTDNDSDNTGILADSGATDATWTYGIVEACGSEALLYCFEQP
jgi:cysteine-rich repeat protein